MAIKRITTDFQESSETMDGQDFDWETVSYLFSPLDCCTSMLYFEASWLALELSNGPKFVCYP